MGIRESAAIRPPRSGPGPPERIPETPATFEFPDSSIAWATDNWWGTTDEATIRARIYDREDSASSPWVRYRAFGEDCAMAIGGDRDGDTALAAGERTDDDLDEGIACGDCDDTESEVHVCACELCFNVREDDCDGLTDGADSDCVEHPLCLVVAAGAASGGEPRDTMTPDPPCP